MTDARNLEAIADKLEAAMVALRLVNYGAISAVGYGLVLDARCLIAEALGRLDSVRKHRDAA